MLSCKKKLSKQLFGGLNICLRIGIFLLCKGETELLIYINIIILMKGLLRILKEGLGELWEAWKFLIPKIFVNNQLILLIGIGIKLD
jgi:hypothetical protein